MTADLDADEYEDWLAWMKRVQPFPTRNDPLWGMLLAMTNNAHCDEGDRKRAQDFMPYFDPYEEEITGTELLARLGYH